MSPSLLHGGEHTSGLHNIFSTSITPFDVGGILPLENGNGLSIDDELPVISLDCAFELAMSTIILEHVDHVIEVNERITDGYNIHFAGVKGSPSDQMYGQIRSLRSPPSHLRAEAATTAQEDAAVYRTAGGESLKFSFKPIYVN